MALVGSTGTSTPTRDPKKPGSDPGKPGPHSSRQGPPPPASQFAPDPRGSGLEPIMGPPTLEDLRREAARGIARRASMFGMGDVTKHPHTVAALVQSSLSTRKLQAVAANLDEAYQQVRARNSLTQAIHDPRPDVMPEHHMTSREYLDDAIARTGNRPDHPSYHTIEDAETDASLPVAAIFFSGGKVYIKTEGGSKPLLQSGMSAEPPTGAMAIAAGPNPVATMGGAFGAMFSYPAHWAGNTLDDIGGVPVVGAIVRPIHAGLDVGVQAMNTTLARGGRLLSDVPAAAGMAVAEVRGKDSDWGALLDFWRLDHHDPFTVSVANNLGMDVDDPRFAETAESIDIVAGVVEQVALAKVGVGIYAKTRMPAEMGGAVSAETFANNSILNGGTFNKLAKMFDEAPPGPTSVGRVMASTRNISPRLAQAFHDAYRAGKTRSGGITNMKRVFVDVIENSKKKVTDHLHEVNDALARDPENLALRAERTAAESLLETIRAKEPIGQWPRYQDIRASLKGVPATTRSGRFLHAMYERRPFKAATDVVKTTDNVRSKPALYDWTSRKAPKDAMAMNAQNAARWMRAARVPENVVSRVIGQLTEPGISFDRWHRQVTKAAVEAAPDWADPVTVKQLQTAARNNELFTNRSNFTETTPSGVEVRRPMIERDDGVTPPTQINETLTSTTLPDMQLVHDTVAQTARLKRSMHMTGVKKWFDNAMAGWRSQVIFSRGPAISMTIQAEEGLMRVFTNNMGKGGRFTDWVIHKLPIHEEAQAAIAQRLGLADVHEARMIYGEMKKHPEMLGQMMGETASETTFRIEVPIKRFRDEFMRGELDLKSPEVRQVFSDITWEIEHAATSPDTVALLRYGPETTARILLGENRPGAGAIPEGTVRLFSERRATELPGIREGKPIAAAAKGEVQKPVVWSQERLEGINARRALEGTLEPDKIIVEHWVPEAEARRVGTGGADAVQHGAIPPERILHVYEGGKPALRPNLRMEEFGRKLVEDTAHDPSYMGLDDHARVVEFLTRKEAELQRLSGGNPEVVDLMTRGRTTTKRLADPEGDLDLVQDELEQLHMTAIDPDISPGVRASLYERRLKLLDSVNDSRLTVERRLRITKNNTAIREWLANEALEGRYEIPKYTRSKVSRAGYDKFMNIHRGFISRVSRTQYAAMKYMNSDMMRGGFAQTRYLKWKARYKKLGWTDAEASKAATAQAMFDARDWLHDIGNKSSFQRFFRNEMPFYHAWERVAYRWFVKVPNMMGAGFTPLGWALESNIVHGLEDALEHLGVIQRVEGPDGKEKLHAFLPNPAQLLNWIPGFEAPDRIDVFSPMTVLLPPEHLLAHPPGLAPQAQFALNAAADWTHMEWLKDWNDAVTLDGSFGIQFPGAGQATKLWEAVTGDVPPWAIGHSKNYQEYVVQRARDGALRYAYTELMAEGDPPPNPEDYEHLPEYEKARDAWWGRWTSLADEYHTGMSFTNLLAIESPLSSFKPTTQEEVAWRQFLQDNNLNKDDRTEADWQLIHDYLSDHPESLSFNVGMFTETSKFPEDKGYASFRDAIGRGDIKVLSPADFRSKLALSQEWEYKNEADRIALQKAGLGNWEKWGVQKRLLHYGEYLDATRPAWENFNEFLEGDDNAKRLYEEHRSEVSKINDAIQEVKADNQYLSGKSLAQGEKRLQALYDKRADATDYGTTPQEHVKWYRNVVMNEYYNQAGAIWDRIDELEATRGPTPTDAINHQYDLLRKLNANYPEIVGPDGKRYPAPEMYMYTSKTDAEKKEQRGRWAGVPPSWLSPIAYTLTYGKPDGKVKQYFNQEQMVQDYFDAKTADVSHSSDEYQAWIKWREKSLDILAERAGTEDIRRLESAPKIVRMTAAGLTPESEGMDWITNQSKMIASRLQAEGTSMWSSSELAQFYRGWLENYINRMRDPQSPLYDARVDHFFSRQAHETGIQNPQDLYRYVLFGITGEFTIPINYPAENKAATA